MASGAIIGLDIGNTTIKAAEVRSGKGGAYVAALGIAPTPLDSIDQNMILDAPALGAAVKELLVSCGAKARTVVSSVAGQQSLVVRIIEVPRMSEKELAETMKWEVERHVPFASQETQMDYQIISRPDLPPEVQTMEVLLVVAQQEMINNHLEVLRYAGLDPRAIDVEPLAEPRSVVDIRGAEQMQKTVAVVNIGANITDISIVREGYLLFQRTIATAGNTLTQAIAEALNVSKDEAERLKKTHAAVDLEGFSGATEVASAFGVTGDEETPFGFGAPVFDTPAATPAAEEQTLFNPFATESDAPAAADAPASPFATAAPEAEAPPSTWSPFGGALAAPEDAPAAEAASPFAAPAVEGETDASSPFAAPAGPAESPFALTPAASEPASPFAVAAEGEDAFDLSAFAGDDAAPAAPASVGEVTPEQVFAIIRDPLSDLVTEIKRSVDYFRGRSSDSAIDLLVLSGGTARLPNLDQLLSGELSLPVEVANPFQAVPVQSSQYPEEYLRQVAPMFAVSVGLGLRETVF